MKAKYASAIGAVLVVGTALVVLGSGFGAAQNAPDQGKGPKGPIENPKTLSAEQDDEPQTKKIPLTVEAQNHDTREPLAGATVRILEISQTAPSHNSYSQGDPRKVLRVVATGVTGSDGRFTAKVPATAVLTVETTPPPGSWVAIDTPPLVPGWGCKEACVEVVVQDGKFMWRSNGNAGHYRPVNDFERENYEPLVFTFRCI